MIYGDLYGALYGGGASAYELEKISRLLRFTQADVILPMLVRVFAVRAEGNINLANQLAETFDLTTGVGYALDVIGTIVQRPRDGLTDERYRALLAIQIQIILSTAGSTDTLLEIISLWTGLDPVAYYEVYPAAIVVSAEESVEFTPYLISLLRTAKPGGVALTLIVTEPDEDALIMGSSEAAVSGETFMGSSEATITGEGLMATVYSI